MIRLWVLRAAIMFTYAMLVLPWIFLLLTKHWMFAIEGVGFALLGGIFWPKAREDWNANR